MDFPGFIPGLRWPSTHAGNWCPRSSLQGRRVSVSIGCVVLSLCIGGVCVECVSVVCVGLCVSSDATPCTWSKASHKKKNIVMPNNILQN